MRTPTRRLRLQPLESRLTPSNSPVLIKDIAPGIIDSSPTSFAAMGDFIYFSASTGTATTSTVGDELWRTDGTAGGTTLVADIFPGGSGLFVKSGSPRDLTAVGGTLFFTATEGTAGVELWKSDGTTAGTVRVKDIRPGATGSNPTALTAVGGTLYFVATDAATGTELWKSDGTEAGTVPVSDLSPGSASTSFGWVDEIGGRLIFTRTLTTSALVEVFAVTADGAGVAPVVTYTAPGSGKGVGVVGSRLFYQAREAGPRDTLYVVDTAAPAPTPLVSFPTTTFATSTLGQLAGAGGRLFFAGETAVGIEPWVSDGTAPGTHLIKDVSQDTPTNNPGSRPAEFTAVGGAVYFAATTIAHGRELWRTDGTDGGTREVADFEPGDTSSSPTILIDVGGHLVFNTLAETATLRQHDPATGQTTAFPGFGLLDPGFFATTYSPWAVVDGVLYMSQKVAADNLGTEPYKLEFDPSVPAVAGYDADTGVVGDGVTADPTPRLFGTTSPNATVRVYDQATLLGSATANADGQWEVTTTPLADGPHTLVARAVNRSGVETVNSNALTITVDTTPPPAPVIASFGDNSGAADDTTTNDPTITLAGTAAANATVRVLDGGTILGEVAADAGGTWSFTTPALADGPHPFTARAIDAAGNESPAGSVFSVVIDTAAPAAPAITGFSADGGVAGDGLTNDNTPTLTGTAEADSTVQILDGLIVLGTAPVGAGGAWQFTTPVRSDGPHSFTAIAADLADNRSPASSPLALTIDTVRPAVTIEQAAGQADPTNGSAVVFDVRFGKPVTGFTAAGIDLSAGSVGGTLVAEVAGSGTDYTVSVSGMAGEGTVIASVVANAATDVAGNGNPASTSTDNVVRFDAVAPSVTIDQAIGQADPTDAGPILFTVKFGEPVSGFTEADVSFIGSTSPSSLVATVSGSGAAYTVSVSGMTGAQTVVASLPAGAALDAAGNGSAASTSSDNVVTFNDIGVLQFSVASFDTAEGVGEAVVTVTRSQGSRRAIAVNYTAGDGTAHAPTDYAATAGTLTWADGDTAPKTFLVPITDDPANEGRELIHLTLSGPTNEAILGPRATADLAIAPSDGRGPGTFMDVDGDLVSVKLTPKTGAGSLLVYLTDPDGDGAGPIEWIALDGPTTKAAVSITAKKPRGGTGDGRATLRSLTGGDLKSLTAKTTDLAGDGIRLTGYLGALAIGNILNGADVLAGGAVTQKTNITAGTIGDGTAIGLGSALNRLTVAAVGGGSVTAPRAGTISVKGDLGGSITLSGEGVAAGKPVLGTLSVGGSVLAGASVSAPVVGSIKVKRDFAGDVTVSGANVPSNKSALATLSVGGTVRDSLIQVGGNVGSVTAVAFDHSRLFAGYTGADDGSGDFNVPAIVGKFKVTGRTDAFAHSYAIATEFKAITLTSIRADNGGTAFGVFADTKIGSLTILLPEKVKYPDLGPVGDFTAGVV